MWQIIFLFLSLLAIFSLVDGVQISPPSCINLPVECVKSKAIEYSKRISKSIKDGICKEVKNQLQCDGQQFWDRLGAGAFPMRKHIDHISQLASEHAHITKTMVTKPTPWITIGDWEFFGNFHIDLIIYLIFFQQSGPLVGCINNSGHHKSAKKSIEFINNTSHRPGVYLETGGSNGIHASNTLFFNHFLNYTGILIEPTLCGKCQLPFNRPRSINFHGGVCMNETSFDPSEMKHFCPKPQDKCVPESEWSIHVRCSPLFSYIQEANIGNTIDFMSIDVENYNMMLLRSIDWDKLDIRVILLECSSQECYDFLRERGYTVLEAFSIPNIDDLIAWKNDDKCRL